MMKLGIWHNHSIICKHRQLALMNKILEWSEEKLSKRKRRWSRRFSKRTSSRQCPGEDKLPCRNVSTLHLPLNFFLVRTTEREGIKVKQQGQLAFSLLPHSWEGNEWVINRSYISQHTRKIIWQATTHFCCLVRQKGSCGFLGLCTGKPDSQDLPFRKRPAIMTTEGTLESPTMSKLGTAAQKLIDSLNTLAFIAHWWICHTNPIVKWVWRRYTKPQHCKHERRHVSSTWCMSSLVSKRLLSRAT